MKSAGTGLVYFIIIFSLGFLLGTFRVLILLPRMGEVVATLLELPVMLIASWYVSGWLIDRFQVSPSRYYRLLMGGIAFSLLMIAEALLGLAFGRPLAEQGAALLRPAGALGLAGQLLFGLMPWIRYAARRH
ncbi:MAG: hypothetical protein ACRCU5_10825 [Rhizobiaceae bacterium]